MTPDELKLLERARKYAAGMLTSSIDTKELLQVMSRCIDELEDEAAEKDAEIQRLHRQLRDCERDKDILASMS